MQSKYFKKPLKWLLYLILFLLTAFVIAYISAPYWFPSQIQRFLPQQLQVKNLELERPGLRSVRIKQLEFEFKEETNTSVLLKNIKLDYSILGQKLTAINAEQAQLQIINSNVNSNKAFSNKISIPEIPVERINIEQLNLAGFFIQDLNFNDLQLITSDKQFSVTSQLSFLGLEFDLGIDIQTLNNYVSNITTQILQDTDKVSLSLTPSADDETSFAWSLNTKLNINNYFPIDSLSFIEATGQGDYQHRDIIKLNFSKGFSLTAPIETDTFDLDSIISEISTEKGVKFDSSQFTNPIHFLWSNKEAFEFSFNPESYQIELTHGSFNLTTQHPMLDNQITIEQLSLNPNVFYQILRKAFREY